jgi:hypothetical protein
MKNHEHCKPNKTHTAPSRPARGGPFDKVQFAEKLADAILMRRAKAEPFISEEAVEAIFDDCMAVGSLGKTEESTERLQRIWNDGTFLAVAGNWDDYLEMFGLSRQDWNQRGGGLPGGA